MKTATAKSNNVDNAKSAAPPTHNNMSIKSTGLDNPLWHNLATHVCERSGARSGGETFVQRIRAKNGKQRNNNIDVQTKLTLGAADDLYEREADTVADRVMRMPLNDESLEQASPIQRQPSTFSPIQRMCAGCVDESSLATPSVQSKSDTTGVTGGVPSSVQKTLKSPGTGSPINDSVRSRIEPVLGTDLSNVRVHSGGAAQEASHSLNAQAFTHRNNIYLARGQSATDVGLMAHEATHVRQQVGVQSPPIQRRIVMRTTTPQMQDSVQVGSTENLRPLTDAEIESYINDIGTVHHDYDDIISGRGEESNFVSNETYRRGLITSIIRNLHSVRTNIYFDNYREAVREVRKRALISLFMRASQGRTRGSKPTGYPRSCGADPGPRVSQAAATYWIVHPDAGREHYWFELSSDGKTNAHEALRTLIFNHQNSACLRTLMHCDYMIAAQQYFVMADVMGATDFNHAVLNDDIKLEIRWNSFENIVADTSTSPGQFQSLQSVDLSSESDFIIGDHVIFFNHDAFDDLNEVHWNARGNYSNWRLENAIISDIDSSGEFRFQGHGYFRPKRRSVFVTAMVGKMNDLVSAARSAIAAGNTHMLGFDNSDGSRFEVVRSDGSNWNIHYHEGLGTEPGLSVHPMPLRNFTAADYPNPFAAPGATSIQVRRPIESRRESIGGTQPAAPNPALPSPTPPSSPSPGPSPSPSPLPIPNAPAPRAPAPTSPTPTPVPTTPAPTPLSLGPATGPVTGQNPQQQQPQQQRQPQRQQPQQPQPPTTPASPCPFICTRRHLLGARTPHHGRDDDFNHYDFPSLSASEWVRVAPFRLMSDSLLEFGMNNVLGLLGGADGRAMVSHFRGGTGATWTHGIGSTLNRDATHCPSVNGAVSNVQTQLTAQMRAMRVLGRTDCSALSLSPVPNFHFGFGDSVALKAIIGGTQGLEVYLNAMRLKDPATCSYDLDLQLEVFDDFGVDTSDLYWPALVKFWILQHERRGNRPFINKLLVNRTVTV